MGALVEDLLELSRLESGERPPRARAVDVAEVADDVAASFADAGRAQGGSLACRHAAAPTVASDADRLRADPREPGRERGQVHARRAGAVAHRDRGAGTAPSLVVVATTGPGSPPSTCRGSSSASTASTRRAAASWAARAWASRS